MSLKKGKCKNTEKVNYCRHALWTRLCIAISAALAFGRGALSMALGVWCWFKECKCNLSILQCSKNASYFSYVLEGALRDSYILPNNIFSLESKLGGLSLRAHVKYHSEYRLCYVSEISTWIEDACEINPSFVIARPILYNISNASKLALLIARHNVRSRKPRDFHLMKVFLEHHMSSIHPLPSYSPVSPLWCQNHLVWINQRKHRAVHLISQNGHGQNILLYFHLRWPRVTDSITISNFRISYQAHSQRANQSIHEFRNQSVMWVD